MKARAVIVEDEAVLRAQLEELLAGVWPDLEIVASAADGVQALTALEAHRPEVLFLDIEMPGMTGLEVAREASGRCHVVFVTAYTQYAVAAFDAGAVDYVLKPFDGQRLALAVARVQQRLNSRPAQLDNLLAELAAKVAAARPYLRWITAARGANVRLITVDDICYFQSDTKYTRAVTAAGESLIHTPLKELIESLKVDVLDRYRGQTAFVQAKASSEIARLAHGPLALAVGAERRRESFATRLDPLHLAGDVTGSGNNGVADAGAARSVDAAFIELNWPAAVGVEVQLAARHDRYSDFGASTSPKVALRWQPVKTVLLRASVGRGFLPPSLPQVNKPREAFDEEFVDPIRCPVTGSADDCLAFALHSREGNAQLKAERSRQHNIGIVLEPIPELSVSLDVWCIVHRDKIMFGDRFILDNETAFLGRVVRAPPSADDLARGLPGPLVELRDTYINLAQRDVRGADLELRMRLAPRPWGTLSFEALLSRIHRFDERITPTTPAVDRAGSDGLPRTRGNVGIGWQLGPWQAGVNARYIGGYRYEVEGSGVMRAIPSWTVFDLNAGWRGLRDQLLLTLQNVADRAPPVRDALNGYDPLVHDPLGRFVSLSWRHSF